MGKCCSRVEACILCDVEQAWFARLKSANLKMAMDGKVGDHATHDPLRSLKLHSSTSRERYGKPTAKKVDLFAVGMVMAKQYNTTHVKIRRKVNVKMLRNIGIFRSLSENLLKKLADEFLTKSYHTSDKIIKQNEDRRNNVTT